jgi:signal transduction histidine kinase
MKSSLHIGKIKSNRVVRALPRVFLVVVVLIAIGHIAAQAQSFKERNVLIITELGASHPATILVGQQIVTELQATPGYQVEVYTESLDAMAFPNKRDQDDIRARIVNEYRGRKIDLIVAIGPSPIRFLADTQDTFLPSVPVVICCSTVEQAGNPTLGSRFTGTWFELDPGKTVAVALKLLPRTENIFWVGGSSPYDRVVLDVIRKKLTSFPGGHAFTYLVDLPMPELQEKLRSLPAHSVVIYSSFWRDSAGRPFLNATAALPLISEASNAPVFGLSDTYIGHGIVGGDVLSFAAQAKGAAGAASEILQAKDPKDIPIATLPNVYLFDWKQLKRWGIPESKLPPGSIVTNRESTLWERNKLEVITSLMVIAILSLLTVYLLAAKRRLQAAKDALVRLSGQLINAQDSERRRLASELHDDFSQRMAVLSLGLEIAAEKVSDSPKEAESELHRLLDVASEIGSDLHAISHRLHSSTLKTLGLVAGVRSFCNEFTAQQGVRVEFMHNEIPRTIPPDLALCLFRIVQEALRNVKKHSKATEATVELRASGKSLDLRISDKGTGFDTNRPSPAPGIGLLSMEERVRLVGGKFRLQSAINEGTLITVSIPCVFTSAVQEEAPEKTARAIA